MTSAPDGLLALRDDVIARWRASFARIAETAGPAVEAAETVYSQYPAYPLDGWRAEPLVPGVRLSKTPIDGGHEIVRDAKGRPLRYLQRGQTPGDGWRGVYHHRDAELEYLEFAVRTGVPSIYQRLVFDAGAVVEEQRLVCNQRGHKRGATTADAILADPHAYFVWVTRYRIEGGRQIAGERLAEIGGAQQRTTIDFSYDGGRLVRVAEQGESGELVLFARKTGRSMKALAETLAVRIADAAIARLREAEFVGSLALLEMNYRSDQPVPVLIPSTTSDEDGDLALASRIPAERWIELDEDSLQPELAELVGRAEASSDDRAIPKLLRAAARRVTEQAPSTGRVADGFVAFAIDWTMESDELAKILRQCGASPEQLKAWKRRGWA